MLVQLRMHRTTGLSPVNSPVDGIRILALLPSKWRKDLNQSTGQIVIRVQTNEEITEADISAEVTRILANPEVSHWRLVSCRILSTTHAEREDRS